jgi:dolichol-phosphate mannosyltransferase
LGRVRDIPSIVADRDYTFDSADPSSLPEPYPQLALVIPTLHEAANIRIVLERIRESLDPLGISYELIVVDDDSGDGTEAIVQEMAETDHRLRFVCRAGRRGLGSAVRSGWRLTQAEVMGVIDADLQHPPELLPELWTSLQAGNDVVLASRYVAQGTVGKWHPGRYLLSRLATFMTGPLQKPCIRVTDPMSGFFLLRRICVRDIVLQTNGFKLLLEILVRANLQSVAEVPFTFGSRRAGYSKAGLHEAFEYILLLARLSLERAGYLDPADPA